MKIKNENINIAILEKEDGTKLLIPPNSVVRVTIDGEKTIFDEWFYDNVLNSFYNESNNTYVFDMDCCNFTKFHVSSHLVHGTWSSYYLKLKYSEILDIQLVSVNENVEHIRRALECFYNTSIEYGNNKNVNVNKLEDLKGLETIMDIFNVPYFSNK